MPLGPSERVLELRFVHAEVPEGWPDGTFDLIVLSETLYFLTAGEVSASARRAAQSLAPGGEIILVNWLGETDTPLTGEAAADLFLDAVEAAGLSTTPLARAPRYRIDRASGAPA